MYANNQTTTSATTKSRTQPLPPVLKSLWNIPHVIRIPDPMPAVPDIIKLIEQHIFDWRIEKGLLDPAIPDHAECIAVHNCNIAILLNKIEELHRAFPHLRAQNFSSPDSLPSAQKLSEEKSEPYDPTIPNQRPATESEASPGESEASPGESEVTPREPGLTSSELASLKPTSGQPPKREPKTGAHNEHDHEDDDEASDQDDEDFDIADYLDDESLEAALDLRDHLSGRSPLDKLEPRVQQAILRLLDDHKAKFVAEAIAEPPPIGLGVRTSKASLNRFRERFDGAKQAAIKAQNNKAVDDLLAKANDTDDAFQSAIQRLLKTRLLLKTSDPDSDLAAIHSLINSLTKLRRQNLAERKLQLAETK